MMRQCDACVCRGGEIEKLLDTTEKKEHEIEIDNNYCLLIVFLMYFIMIIAIISTFLFWGWFCGRNQHAIHRGTLFYFYH